MLEDHIGGCRWQDDLDQLLGSLSHIDLSDDIFEETEYLQAHGGFCDVFMAKSKRHGGMTVAVKRLRIHIFADKNISKIVLRELKIWSSLKHPNVLPLLGYVMHDKYPAFVSQWMVNGTVRKYMENNPQIKVISMAQGIADGLKYLHEKDVIHSDLKTDNVLVSIFGEPLLSDFGISRLMTTMNTTTSTANSKGSARWMAIELLTTSLDDDPLGATCGLHTKATDVWAYGMLIYELLTGFVPFWSLRNDLQVAMAIVNGQTPTVPPSLNTDNAEDNLLWRICQNCWERSPANRPTMTAVSDAFGELATPTASESPLDSTVEFVYSSAFKSADDADGWRRWVETHQNSPPASPFRWSDMEVEQNAKTARGHFDGQRRSFEVASNLNIRACSRCLKLKVKCEYFLDDRSTCRRCALSGWDCVRSESTRRSGKYARPASAIGFINDTSRTDDVSGLTEHVAWPRTVKNSLQSFFDIEKSWDKSA